ncbi:S-adenosyl-L-methionine-dependent methyltransferase [Coniochaeta ligniaria NRRL 30616]|uniref:S-adenosyl-L-methionine-dependent methyltransferase n=1 Tax=Coniochaeta ligniaria NRRL 30616 TaxID=1408157 RepID=A0A1J7JYX8_9PEZI|nr:S-adenosyl-L-methionine-dependent methyltransferase [Coniochaeta ligniaria NRRL 30616]
MQFGSETQPQSAQRMYDSRAASYEDSWHPSYAIRFTSHLSIAPGDAVLDLCCGTGLKVFAAAEKVGPTGSVVGVDVSDGMLAQARQKQAANPEVGKRCLLLKGDVAKLDEVFAAAGLGGKKGAFDWITCSSAFVLLDDPSAALAHWKAFLKPGGRMAIDVPHEHNLRAGAILERVAKRLRVAMPFNRSWVESSESFIKLAEKEGLEVEKFELLERVMGEKISYYSLDEADEQFDKVVNGSLTTKLDVEEFKEKARPLFHEEWAKAAVDGKVAVADALYLYILRKAGQS